MFFKYVFKKLIEYNYDIIESTAIKNCHVDGLHSFVLNKSPKIRLFIADENCALRNSYSIYCPILTIHPHKHNDIFVPLTATKITHHLYKISPSGIPFRSINFKRLDNNSTIKICENERLKYIGGFKKLFLFSHELHSVSIDSNGKCAWLILECGTDKNFKQISYGGAEIPSTCYQKFIDPVTYIKDYFQL